MKQIKFIFRKLWREKFFSFLKVIGLAIGIATCLVIFKIVHYEYSFDKMHPDKESIYQMVVWHHVEEGKSHGFGGVQSSVAGFVGETFPEIEQVVPVNTKRFSFLNLEKPNGEVFRKEDPIGVQYTVPAYFDMVPYQWLAGNKATAFSLAHQVVLTKSRVDEYFGDLALDAVVGKTIYYENTGYTISGVVADLDFPSSFEGKEFMPALEVEKADSNWYSFNSNYTLFLKLEQNQKQRLLQSLDAKYDEMLPEAWKRPGNSTEYSLLPLSEKHFSPNFGTGNYTANKKIVFGLIGIGAFILLLAGINYINLSTAQIPYRVKEIGVRKTLGESNKSLTLGFLMETLIICLFGIALAFPLAKGFELVYADFMPKLIHNYSYFFPTLLFVLGIGVVITFATGLYPAYLTNKVNVSEVLKIQGAGKLSFGSLSIRKSMIVFQFVIAQVFVIGAFIIASQINYMIEADLGFDKDAVVTMDIPWKEYQNAEVDPFLFKQDLQKYPEIRNVALGHIPVSRMHWGNTLIHASDTSKIELNMNFKYVDTDYIKLYGIKMLAGREPEARDTLGSVFINEAARIGLGFKSNEEAVNQNLLFSSNQPIIIAGVFNNFHQRDLHDAIKPLSIRITKSKDMLENFNVKLASSPSDWSKSIGIIEKEWKNRYPNAPFAYEFHDAQIAKLYTSDIRQAKMINLATGISIVLGCLGLTGLVTLTAFQRTKEIGIRKVLGSSVMGIIVLLAKEYFKLVGLAIVISIPIAWWAMNKWLENFAFTIEIRWWMFLATGLATLFIALLAVGYHSLKAAKANPVKSLRAE